MGIFAMGGAVALMAIPQAPEIKAVVSQTSYASLALMAPELFRIPLVRYPLGYLVAFWARLFLGMDVRTVSPMQAVQDSDSEISVLLIHSSNDDVVPFSQALLLQQALKNNPRAEFWHYDGAGHGQLQMEYRQRVADFFRRHL